jgi:hypothetical protein
MKFTKIKRALLLMGTVASLAALGRGVFICIRFGTLLTGGYFGLQSVLEYFFFHIFCAGGLCVAGVLCFGIFRALQALEVLLEEG